MRWNTGIRGNICRKGHDKTTVGRTQDNGCKLCLKTKCKEWAINNRDKMRRYCKNYSLKHSERAKAKHRVYKHTLEGRYSYLKGKVKALNLECDVSFDVFSYLVSLPCEYCGDPLSTSGVGLDRVDSSRGYTIDNVLSCCKDCNRGKMDLPVVKWIAHMKQILKYSEGRLKFNVAA